MDIWIERLPEAVQQTLVDHGISLAVAGGMGAAGLIGGYLWRGRRRKSDRAEVRLSVPPDQDVEVRVQGRPPVGL